MTLNITKHNYKYNNIKYNNITARNNIVVYKIALEYYNKTWQDTKEYCDIQTIL